MPETPAPPASPGPFVTAAHRVARVALSVLPGPWRRSLGYWRWSEINARHYIDVLFNRKRASSGPAHGLLRRGLQPGPRENPWPRSFDTFHCAWNWDNRWGVLGLSEMEAWARIWRAHPKGQACLDRALVGVAQAGHIKATEILLAAGANPQARPEAGALMHHLWGAEVSFDKRLAVWRAVCAAGPAPSWQSWVDDEPVARRYTAEQLDQWQASGLPMPTGEAALRHALAWVDDPPLASAQNTWPGAEPAAAAIAAVGWFKRHGQLPSSAPTRLLQRFLETARPGEDEDYQQALRAWSRVLLDQGVPSRPPQGPRKASAPASSPPEPALPWSHWVGHAIFFENLPGEFLQPLFDEPDAWTATNRAGEDALALFERRMIEVANQSRERGLEKFRPWLRTRQLENALPEVSVAAAPVASRPRL